ncbi:MAG: tetraacyldisaccharide 4'-kinase [Vampirovibrionales bacterium]|nr:tetraacyldisaccharide 4'-kinase [Vampirovibrionales bacterium]
MRLKSWVHLQHYTVPTLGWMALTAVPTLFYQLAVLLRNAAYQSGQIKRITAPCPVISIGNLTTGGTGKTPVTLAIAKALHTKGLSSIILSRGYGAKTPLAYGEPEGAHHGDEAYELKLALAQTKARVIVGQQRAKNALAACKQYAPDVVLLDDGLQYCKLAGEPRHDIVLIDGEYGLGNYKQLPMGPLRESAQAALARASVILVTRVNSDAAARLKLEALGLNVPANRPLAVHACPIVAVNLTHILSDERQPLQWLQHQPIMAFCGIAQPERFMISLIAQQAVLNQQKIVPDHHVLTPEDWHKLMQSRQSLPVITTQKDAVKLQQMAQNNPKMRKTLDDVWVLNIEAQLPEGVLDPLLGTTH